MPSLATLLDSERCPWPTLIATYLTYFLIVVFGTLADVVGKVMAFVTFTRPDKNYASLFSNFDRFFHYRIYFRGVHCFNHPIRSAPGAWIDVVKRASKDHFKTWYCTDETYRALNFGSYNYLGFASGKANAQNEAKVVESFSNFGITMASPRANSGYSHLHAELEQTMADFIHKEAAIIFAMGFATNSTTIPALVGPDGLIISDSLNHASIVVGGRASVGHKKVFRHDDMAHLEKTVRNAILNGMPRTHNHWSKIVIVVEGIYSMEGGICNLPEIVRIAKQYGCYLYVDEAHSIGALGHHAGGVCDFYDDRFALLDWADAHLLSVPGKKEKAWTTPSLWGSVFHGRQPDLEDLRQLHDDHVRFAGTRKALHGMLGPQFSFFDQVDVLMGTYTKSFASVGGYIAGSADLIDYLRRETFGAVSAEPMAPGCVCQIKSVIDSFTPAKGASRESANGLVQVDRLARNTQIFRRFLYDHGFQIMGDHHSPVVPMLLYAPNKIPAFFQEAINRGIATVVVAYPACSLIASRVRFCLSAAMTEEDIAWALEHIDELGDVCSLKYDRKKVRKELKARVTVEDVWGDE
ncbi:Serine-C-palmitoyltransferase long chain base biosynthesis protein 1 [Carpediemonas membranifera]|uniref:serine C-palmitoyltransferase n=1 Tax=Carpediemonas membranifera TaxID=201153 RepID=A0A8J6DZU3_9EUKA|nr:Serine-C-palmitoyltransferase long chain base biosynthesis protein 1 [Carpediemonas membranifera]|eukprot:KAG9390896.1 Serine-C-palmitoyltransferase long chain base biosynthesis protein 1 [Carpediemonas membranifera]